MICATDGRTLPLRPLLLELAVLSSDCGRLTTTLLGAVLGGVRCRLLWLTGGGVAAAAVRGGVVTTPAWCSRTDAASAAVAHGAPAPAASSSSARAELERMLLLLLLLPIRPLLPSVESNGLRSGVAGGLSVGPAAAAAPVFVFKPPELHMRTLPPDAARWARSDRSTMALVAYQVLLAAHSSGGLPLHAVGCGTSVTFTASAL